MVDRITLIEGFLWVHRVSLASMVLAFFILLLHSSTSNTVRSEGLAASVNATFLSLSFCPPVWADSRSVIHGTGSLITVFTQDSSSGTYLEASLKCSHKILPLELTWKIRLNINNEFVPVFPKSDYPTRILSVLLTSPIGFTFYVYWLL